MKEKAHSDNLENKSFSFSLNDVTIQSYFETLHNRALLDSILFNQALIIARMDGHKDDESYIFQKLDLMRKEVKERYDALSKEFIDKYGKEIGKGS